MEQHGGAFGRSTGDLRYDDFMAPRPTRMFCLLKKKCKPSAMIEALIPESVSSPSKALRAIGWTSVAVGVTALGLYIGHELRVRYKFKRRTPSDYFAHAGEDLGPEFGMGI
jgi:hypothetical protein